MTIGLATSVRDTALLLVLAIGLAIRPIDIRATGVVDGRDLDPAGSAAAGRCGSIERIELRGNRFTRDKVILRTIGIAEGQRVGVSDLDRARRRLEALGYFLGVEVTTRPGSARGRVTLEISLNEKPKYGSFFPNDNFILICRISQNDPLVSSLRSPAATPAPAPGPAR